MKLSIRWKLVAPILALGAVVCLLAHYMIVRTAVHRVESLSYRDAQTLSQYVVGMRAYYTSNVVTDAQAAGLTIGHDHATDLTAQVHHHNELLPDIRHTAALVQEVATTCREQSTGIEQTSQALQSLDGVTQQNATAAEQMTVTAADLANQAHQLEAAIAFFKLGTPAPRRPVAQSAPLPVARQLREPPR